MWIFGNANKQEIKELKKQGWDVKKVDIIHFNHALDPNYDFKKDPDIKVGLEAEDIMIAVFVDCDASWQLTQFHNEEKGRLQAQIAKELNDLREMQAQDAFENDDLDGMKCEEHENWEIDGDTLLKKFYYENEENPEEGSRIATFIVTFKKGSDKVIETHINVW